MKSLRKSFLTLLALTLFGGAGAWAQGQLLTTINASSSFTNGTQTFDNIVTVTLDEVSYNPNDGWYASGSPSHVEVAPVNGVTVTSYMLYFSVTGPIEFEGSSFTVALEGDRVLADDISTELGSVGITKIEVYGPAAIELTKAGANQWTLGQTPDYDLELQVEYYEAHALKGIPAGWTVKVNGTDKTDAIVGDSLMITETDSVTLEPAGNPRRVKSVTLEEDVPPATPLDNTTTAWTAGTFAVPAGGLTYSDAITVSGDVTLVLTDGETLTLNKGISLASGATLTIEGNGTMNVNGTNNSTASTVAGTGTLVLTSGTLNAKGGNGQGVGDSKVGTDNRANAGGNAINGNVTVSGGTLTATGGNGGGVGERSAYSYGAAGGVAISGNVTITDGAVTATGGNGGSIGEMGMYEYGGNGGAAIGGDATISGGTWTATDGTHGVNGDGQGGAGGNAVAGTVTDNR